MRGGLELWREHEFDLVVTDCNMPRLSGYELAGAIRDDERAQGLPSTLILGFTANAQPEEKKSAAWRQVWTTACSNPSCWRI